jgi:hypothetical protein
VPTAPGVPAANSYEGQVGDQVIDEDDLGAQPPYAGASPENYRPNDPCATTPVTDAARRQFASGAIDYNVGFLGPGFWQTYTRTWPAGTFNLYGRVASGANLGTLYSSWSQVLAGWGTINQVTTHLGSFAIPSSGGYSAYFYAPLIDRFGNYAQLTLGGTNTFRATELTQNQSDLAAAGTYGINVNFYMLVAARTDLPRIDNLYPNGFTLMQQTNTLSFVASNPTYGINTTNIQVILNGINISSSLAFSGSSTNWNVSYTGLQPNTSYTAAITVTDKTNQTATTTVSFDTFNPNNFTWEAEDYDFEPTVSPAPNGSGLRFIDNPALTSSPATNSYYGQEGDGGQISGSPIDYSSVFGLTHPGTYIYRSSDYVSAEVTSDAPRTKYLSAQLANIDPSIQDYDVNFWDTNGWINYTRTFPTGNYYVFARLSGGNGAFNLQCSQVTSGAGTSTQTTQYLGAFAGSDASFANWQYVPLVNTNTGQPISLSLGGVETLQMTGDYNENANFFMLVTVPSPASLTAALNGNSVVLSFPSKSGVFYTVLYKNHLTDGTWTPLTTIAGDGTTKTYTDTHSQGARFYRLLIQ